MAQNNGDLIKAARSGDLDSVIRQVSQGADVNAVGPQHNITPLHLASLHGHTEVAQFLLDNGANADALDDWNVTPLHNAAGAGHADIVRELCENGARLDMRSSNRGKMPIEIAREKGKFDVIPILQEYQSKASRNRNTGVPATASTLKDRGIKVYNSGGVNVRWPEKAGSMSRRNSYGGGGMGGMGGGSTGGMRSPMSLPGQIYDDDDDDNIVQLVGQKQNLHKQLRTLERQEQVHRLSRDHARTRDQLEVSRGKYNQDLDQLMRQMRTLQDQINSLASQRDSEISAMEERLHSLQDNMYELDRSGTPDLDDDNEDVNDNQRRQQQQQQQPPPQQQQRGGFRTGFRRRN